MIIVRTMRKLKIILLLIILQTLLVTYVMKSDFQTIYASSPLAEQINASLNEITEWKDMVNIGIIMHKSSLNDFDSWIINKVNRSDWNGVFAVKRYAEEAGYSSPIIDNAVKLALSKIPMFKNYSLPITDPRDKGWFWVWDRYILYAYKYAEELNWEIKRWNKTSGFLALKHMRDLYGKAFYRFNPDTLEAESLFGTRWHEAGALMGCFLIFYELGVKEALNYAMQEWKWLNDNLWSNNHFNYAPQLSNWELSGINVFPHVAKLHLIKPDLPNWDRVIIDLQLRFVNNLWDSPQWDNINKVVVHHKPNNLERRLDGTLTAWIMLHTFYGLFTQGNKTNMKKMLEGNEVTQAWIVLISSDLKQATTNMFRFSSNSPYSQYATAMATLCLFLMGISPEDGRGLAIPLISDRHNSYDALNYRHFEFDYVNHKIKIPVWGGTTLKFMYGTKPINKYFETTGIYVIYFTPDWNSILQTVKVSNLYPNEYYIYGNEQSLINSYTILNTRASSQIKTISTSLVIVILLMIVLTWITIIFLLIRKK